MAAWAAIAEAGGVDGGAGSSAKRSAGGRVPGHSQAPEAGCRAATVS